MNEESERLGVLLRAKKRLKLHEEADLRVWLAELELDCATFGATVNDNLRISAIRRRLGDPPVIHTPIEPSGKSR